MKKYFKLKLDEVSTERLEEYKSVLEELSWIVSTDEENIKEIWDCLYTLNQSVRGELHNRNNLKYEKTRNKAERKKKGEAIALPKKKMVKHNLSRVNLPVKESTEVKPKVRAYVAMPKKWGKK